MLILTQEKDDQEPLHRHLSGTNVRRPRRELRRRITKLVIVHPDTLRRRTQDRLDQHLQLPPVIDPFDVWFRLGKFGRRSHALGLGREKHRIDIQSSNPRNQTTSIHFMCKTALSAADRYHSSMCQSAKTRVRPFAWVSPTTRYARLRDLIPSPMEGRRLNFGQPVQRTAPPRSHHAPFVVGDRRACRSAAVIGRSSQSPPFRLSRRARRWLLRAPCALKRPGGGPSGRGGRAVGHRSGPRRSGRGRSLAPPRRASRRRPRPPRRPACPGP